MVLTLNLGLLQHISTTNLVSTLEVSVFGPRFENEIRFFVLLLLLIWGCLRTLNLPGKRVSFRRYQRVPLALGQQRE